MYPSFVGESRHSRPARPPLPEEYNTLARTSAATPPAAALDAAGNAEDRGGGDYMVKTFVRK
jgi:hypothetical protein